MSDIKELEQSVRRAEKILRDAKSHNDQLTGRIEAGAEELNKLGYSTEKKALTAMERVRKRAEQKFKKLQNKLVVFQTEFEEAKQAMDEGQA